MRLAFTVIVLLSWLIQPVMAATYYVAKSGNDGNTCGQAQSPSTPKATWASGITCLASGDTLRINDSGTYDERGFAGNIPSGGGSWATATIIEGAPGERPIIRPTTGGRVFEVGTSPPGSQSWIHFRNFEIDGSAITPGTACTTGFYIDGPHLRIENITIHSLAGGDGIKVNPSADFAEAIGNEMYNYTTDNSHCVSGSPGQHGMYANGDDMLIINNLVYDVSGNGLQIWQTGTGANFVRAFALRNRIRNADKAGIIVGFKASDSLVAQNVLYDNNNCFDIDGARNDAINNTCMDNVGYFATSTCSGVCTVQNNILWGSGTFTCRPEHTCVNNLNADPSFTNPAMDDFTLAAGSPAINASTVPTVWTGTAQGGTATTIQLAAASTFGNHMLPYFRVEITGGPGTGQVRDITSYDRTTTTATISPAWTTVPTAASTYALKLPWNSSAHAQGAYETWTCTAAESGNVSNTTTVLTCDDAYPPYQAPQGCTGLALAGFSCGAVCAAVTPLATNMIHINQSCATVPSDTGLTTTYTGTHWVDPRGQPMHAFTPSPLSITNNSSAQPTAIRLRGRIRRGIISR